MFNDPFPLLLVTIAFISVILYAQISIKLKLNGQIAIVEHPDFLCIVNQKTRQEIHITKQLQKADIQYYNSLMNHYNSSKKIEFHSLSINPDNYLIFDEEDLFTVLLMKSILSAPNVSQTIRPTIEYSPMKRCQPLGAETRIKMAKILKQRGSSRSVLIEV